jgi:DNA adenine methylase
VIRARTEAPARGPAAAPDGIAAPTKPKPFLKWVGGKRQLLPEILKRLPEKFRDYHEPFLGGGALFFELSHRKAFRMAFISDMNPDLVDAYCAVQDHAAELIRALKKHPHNREYFEKIRAKDPARMDRVGRASRLIYLNKTCYNGLYRVNASGQFNAPFGRYKNPLICDEANLRACAEALRNTVIQREPFEAVLTESKKGDFVYFDPPYDPVSKTASFSSYAKAGFRAEDHERLRDVFAKLDKKGCHVMLSNSHTPFTRALYKGWNLETVSANRAVNSRAAGRGAVKEILVRNY